MDIPDYFGGSWLRFAGGDRRSRPNDASILPGGVPALIPLLAFEVERVPALMILIELGAGQFRITCTHLCFQCCNGGFKLRHSTFRPAQTPSPTRAGQVPEDLVC